MAIKSTNKNFNNLVQYAKLLKKSHRGGNAIVVNKLTVEAKIAYGMQVYPRMGGELVTEKHTVTCILLSNGEIVFEDIPSQSPYFNPNFHNFSGCAPHVVYVY